jgi:hypothetical protein
VLKLQYPSPLTGKLSDFAGLVYFPLFAVACIEAARWLVKRDAWPLTSRAVTISVWIIGVSFTLTKTWHPAGDFYRSAMGFVLWPVSASGNLARGEGLPAARHVALLEDRTDVVALTALLVPIWVSRRIMARPR